MSPAAQETRPGGRREPSVDSVDGDRARRQPPLTAVSLVPVLSATGPGELPPLEPTVREGSEADQEMDDQTYHPLPRMPVQDIGNQPDESAIGSVQQRHEPPQTTCPPCLQRPMPQMQAAHASADPQAHVVRRGRRTPGHSRERALSQDGPLSRHISRERASSRDKDGPPHVRALSMDRNRDVQQEIWHQAIWHPLGAKGTRAARKHARQSRITDASVVEARYFPAV